MHISSSAVVFLGSLFGLVSADDKCDGTVEAADKWTLSSRAIPASRDELPLGIDSDWTSNSHYGKLSSHVELTYEDNNKFRFNVILDNSFPLLLTFTIAAIKGNSVIRWYALQATTGKPISGCIEDIAQHYSDPDTNFFLQVQGIPL